MAFDESKHPRDGDGKFTSGSGTSDYSGGVDKRIQWAKDNGINLPLNDDGSLDDLALQKLYDGGEELANETYEYGSQEELDALLGEEFKGVKGQAAVDKLLKEKRGHVKGAFHRDDIGDIDLFWGNDTVGLQHILKNREAQGINARSFINSLADVIEKGEFYQKSERGNFEFLHNGSMAIIAPEYHGNKITFVLTAYKTRKKALSNNNA